MIVEKEYIYSLTKSDYYYIEVRFIYILKEANLILGILSRFK